MLSSICGRVVRGMCLLGFMKSLCILRSWGNSQAHTPDRCLPFCKNELRQERHYVPLVSDATVLWFACWKLKEKKKNRWEKICIHLNKSVKWKIEKNHCGQACVGLSVNCIGLYLRGDSRSRAADNHTVFKQWKCWCQAAQMESDEKALICRCLRVKYDSCFFFNCNFSGAFVWWRQHSAAKCSFVAQYFILFFFGFILRFNFLPFSRTFVTHFFPSQTDGNICPRQLKNAALSQNLGRCKSLLPLRSFRSLGHADRWVVTCHSAVKTRPAITALGQKSNMEDLFRCQCRGMSSLSHPEEQMARSARVIRPRRLVRVFSDWATGRLLYVFNKRPFY